MVKLDYVKLDGRFRLCYSGTKTIALVAPDNPVDAFETVLDQAAAAEFKRVWILQRRGADKPLGYVNSGQANRAIQMIHEARIVIVSPEELDGSS